MASNRETDDDYGHVVEQLGPKHRLIECKDNIQWILQEYIGKTWRNQNFLTSREGVIRRCSGLPNADRLDGLPQRYASLSQRGPRRSVHASED